MEPVTTAFLVIGGIGVAVLAISLLIGDIAGGLHFGHPDTSGPFSLPSIAGFVGAFGFAGAIAAELTAGTVADLAVAVIVGLLAAIPTAWFAIRLSAWAMNMRTDPTPTRADLVGTTGVVVTPIPEVGYGEVRVTLAGQPMKLYAKAANPLPLGARVFVIAAPSSTSVVVEETPSIEEV